VLVWDTGWFEPVGEKDSLTDMWRSGALDVILHGRRLRGRFALIRMKERPRHWLLIKQRDGEARSDRRNTMMKEWDTSVLTGRTIKDLEQAIKVER
jgi:bifunctional non-homologous end joining protein LigD